jgi:hypothetical protein
MFNKDKKANKKYIAGIAAMGSTIVISLYHPLDNLKYRFMSKFNRKKVIF